MSHHVGIYVFVHLQVPILTFAMEMCVSEHLNLDTRFYLDTSFWLRPSPQQKRGSRKPPGRPPKGSLQRNDTPLTDLGGAQAGAGKPSKQEDPKMFIDNC